MAGGSRWAGHCVKCWKNCLKHSGFLGNMNPTIQTLAHDSRKADPQDSFVCVPGATVDGHSFAAQAVERGAVAVLAEHTKWAISELFPFC